MLRAFLYGWQDAFAPMALASLWLFVMVLSYHGATAKRAFWISASYIFAVVLTNFVSAFGAYDAYHMQEDVVLAIRSTYVVFGVFFAVTGAVSLIDWYRFNFTPSRALMIRVPVSLADDESAGGRKQPGLFRVCFFAFFSGWFMTFLSGIWQEEFVFNVFVFVISGLAKTFSFGVFFSYLIGQVLPFVCAAMVFEFFAGVKDYKDVCLSAAKIVSAAVGLGLGVNLIYLRFI